MPSTNGAPRGNDEGLHFGTLAVHAGWTPNRESFGAINPQIYPTSTFVDMGTEMPHVYTRLSNPTEQPAERVLTALEGGRHATLFSSGMAAINAVVQATCAQGDHVLLGADLYGGTYILLGRLRQWGLSVDFVDLTDPDALTLALRPNTRLVLLESITNPRVRRIDIAAVAARRGSRALVAVDNTVATPLYCRPLAYGAHFVIHSTTKYLNGHGDIIGGAVVTSSDVLAERVRLIRRSDGAVPSPFDAYLLHRGMHTLHLRMPAHTENARQVVELLRATPAVTDIAWPGVSGLLSFAHPAAKEIVRNTRIFGNGVSLGDPTSLITVPVNLTHANLAGTPAAVPANLIRVSCGLEDPRDLVADLDQAIRQASAAHRD